MKAVKREIYKILSNEIGCQLCFFCKHAESNGSCCDEMYYECIHPLHDRHGFPWNDEMPEPDQDCWGFYPERSVELAADIVGVVLASGFDEWFMRTFEDGTIKIYGRKPEKVTV